MIFLCCKYHYSYQYIDNRTSAHVHKFIIIINLKNNNKQFLIAIFLAIIKCSCYLLNYMPRNQDLLVRSGQKHLKKALLIYIQQSFK